MSRMQGGLYFVTDERGTPLSHSNGCGLRAEPWFVCAIPYDRKRRERPDRDDSARRRAGSALLCAVGAVARVAHGALSRFVWINVPVRLAAGADVSRLGGVSPAAVSGRFRCALHSSFLFGLASGARGKNCGNSGARSRICFSRDAEHFGLRGVWAFVCVESDLPG